ncbi:MAG TPA: phosphotransferase, partial [Geminicoccaceae bacterium]|nr:phosphotransferase [Geminicoccaceae bacterium]
MSGREDHVRAFLATAGWAEAERRHLAGDLSNRRYQRLRRADGTTAVLMDAAADQPLGPWLRVQAWLQGAGLHPPAVLAADEAAGLLLLEDLGDDLVAQVVAQGGDEAVLYRAALDVLLRLQASPPPAFLPELDDPALIRLLDLFLEFLAPPAPATAADEFRAIWRAVLPAARLGPDVFVHRDFHSLNLLWRPAAT